MEAQEIAALKKAAIDHPHCSLFPFLLLFHTEGNQDRMKLREHYGINPILLEEWLNTPMDTAETSTEPVAESFNKEMDEIRAEVSDIIAEPIAANEYFLQEGIKVSSELPELDQLPQSINIHADDADSRIDQSLMVVMSFSEWLNYLHNKTKKSKEEEADKRALQSSWRRQKLAAAIEEENEDIPDQVFEMAVNSIVANEDVVSEALAEVYVLQRKIQKAIDMYRKLSLQNPEKSVYFAHKIENLQKEI